MTNSRIELREYARVQSVCQLLFLRSGPASGLNAVATPPAVINSLGRFQSVVEWIESQLNDAKAFSRAARERRGRAGNQVGRDTAEFQSTN